MSGQFGTQRATMDEALAWANGDGMFVPKKGALRAINAGRHDQGLPQFVIGDVTERFQPLADWAAKANAAFEEPEPEAVEYAMAIEAALLPEAVAHAFAGPVEDEPIEITEDDLPDFPQVPDRVTPRPDDVVIPPMRNQTSADLRTMLFEEMRDLRSGASTPQRAVAVAKLAAQIVSSIRAEVDVARARQGTIDGRALDVPTLQLTSDQ